MDVTIPRLCYLDASKVMGPGAFLPLSTSGPPRINFWGVSMEF